MRGRERALAALLAAQAATAAYVFNYQHHGQDWRQYHCGSRERQSPVAFDRRTMGVPPSAKKLWFSYEPVTGSFPVQNSGHAISADFAGQGYGGISYESGWYNLMNINFHAKSEHTFDGMHMPLEMHMVHKKYDGNHVIVVAIPISSENVPDIDLVPPAPPSGPTPDPDTGRDMTRMVVDFPNPALIQRNGKRNGTKLIQRKQGGKLRGFGFGAGSAEGEGKLDPGWYPKNYPPYEAPPSDEPNYNPVLKRFLENELPELMRITNVEENEAEPTDFNKILEGGTYLEYVGSFTVPPCSETITWLVRREPVMASDEQVRFFYEALYRMTDDFGNYRSVMPLNSRVITVRSSEHGIPVAEAPIKEKFPPIPVTRAFAGVIDADKAMETAKENAEDAAELDDRIRAAAQAHADEMNGAKGPPYNMTEMIPRFPLPANYKAPPCDTIACKLSKMGQDMEEKLTKEARNIIKSSSVKLGEMVHETSVHAVHDFLLSQTTPPPPTEWPPPPYPTRSPPASPAPAAPTQMESPSPAPSGPAAPGHGAEAEAAAEDGAEDAD